MTASASIMVFSTSAGWLFQARLPIAFLAVSGAPGADRRVEATWPQGDKLVYLFIYLYIYLKTKKDSYRFSRTQTSWSITAHYYLGEERRKIVVG